MNYSSTQDLADESGMLLPEANAHPKRRGVAAALVALCFASGVAYASTSSSAVPSFVGDKSTDLPDLPGVCGKDRMEGAEGRPATTPGGNVAQVIYTNFRCSTTDERLINLEIDCHDDTQFLSLCYDTCIANGYSYASVFNGQAGKNTCSCHKTCNTFETVAPNELVWATAVPVDWLPLNAESHASKAGLDYNGCFDGNCRACENHDDCREASDQGHNCFWDVPYEIPAYCRPRLREDEQSLRGAAKASPPASTFESALTCDTYKQWPIDNMGLHVIHCEGKDACKEDPPTRLNAGIDQLGTLLVCDGEKACADSLFFLDGSGPALPVVALCCGEGACEGNYQFDVWPLTGVDAYGYCKGKDACKGSGASWFVAEGNTLTMDCDGSQDGTCEDATFRVGSGPARCTGGGSSNAEAGSCVHTISRPPTPAVLAPTAKPTMSQQPTISPQPTKEPTVAPPTPSSAFDASAVTCANYAEYLGREDLKVINCVGKDACEDDNIALDVTDNTQIGVLVACVGEDACEDARLTMGAGKVVPVAALCCGEDTCSDLKFSVTIEAWTGPSPGVDAHVYCTGEDACEDSEWTVAPGHSLTVFCDGTSDTCDDAKFIVEGGETAVCNGPGCSNAEMISRRVM